MASYGSKGTPPSLIADPFRGVHIYYGHGLVIEISLASGEAHSADPAWLIEAKGQSTKLISETLKSVLMLSMSTDW